jgi:membrane-bound lytic murein transglycosylase F
MALRLLVLMLIPCLALAGVVKHVSHDYWTDEYDAYFRKYAKHYFGPHIDWRWFKAQGIAESGLKADARSSMGAKGVMQIMPRTYQEIKEKNPHFTRIDEPRWNIAAGIYYDRELYRRWKRGLPTQQRIFFALASYNAGYSNINKAYRRAKKSHSEVKQWEQVAPFAPSQTRHYVRRIKGLMDSSP